MDERLRLVVEANIALQKRAKELNIRAGEVVFPTMSQSGLKQWLAERLNGARRVAEISSFEYLRLPELDQGLIDLVLEENPNMIEVNDHDLIVNYRPSYKPQIVLEDDTLSRWISLPDAGVKLPSGRLVEVKVVVSSGWNGTYYADTNIPALKEKVRNQLNLKAWENWSKPEIVIPDLVVEDASIPEIVTQNYGQCVVTADPLMAYGTIIAYRSWSSDPVEWRYDWYRDRKDAEGKRVKAVEELVQYQSEQAKKRIEEEKRLQLAEARAEAEEVKEEVRRIYLDDNKSKLSPTLRDKICNIFYSSIPYELEGVRQWISNAQNIISEAEKGFAEIEKKRVKRREAGIQVPDILLQVYQDEDTAYEFMKKVAALRTCDLDEHIVCSCGRDRVRQHLVQVSGDEEFFLGADPNSVKYYIRAVHYGSDDEDYGVTVVEKEETKVVPPAEQKPPTSNSMAALLAKFGR